MRIGYGYDAHRLVKGRELVLGGVTIPHETGLDGHSDADVLVHALMDAILGAAALGDIGCHFPDTNPKYKGISSIALLEEVGNMLREEGFSFNNADCTIIAQAPKLVPFTREMRENIADALGTRVSNINIKATTEERMGFTGSGEGIAANAVVLINKKIFDF